MHASSRATTVPGHGSTAGTTYLDMYSIGGVCCILHASLHDERELGLHIFPK
jgi:hypothetical protein